MNNELLVSNIKKCCKKNNITVTQLEKEINVSQGLIGRWLKPDSKPSLEIIDSLASYFNIPLYLFFTDSLDVEKANDNKVQSLNNITLDLSFVEKAKKAKWRIYDDNAKRYNQFDKDYNEFKESFDYQFVLPVYTVVDQKHYLLLIGYVVNEIDNVKLYGLAGKNFDSIELKYPYNTFFDLAETVLDRHTMIKKYLGLSLLR